MSVYLKLGKRKIYILHLFIDSFAGYMPNAFIHWPGVVLALKTQ